MSEAKVEGKVKVKFRERGEGEVGLGCLKICAHSRAAAQVGIHCLKLELVAAIALTMTMSDSKEASQVGPNTHFDLAVEIAA